MSSKFSISRGRGKTPAICKKVPRPKPKTIPDSDHPIIHPRPLFATIDFRSINPAHPWHYAHRQMLRYAGGIIWSTQETLDLNFKLSVLVFYNFTIPQTQMSVTINHQNHGDHVATAGPTRWTGGPAFYIPRLQLDVTPHPRYQCNVTLTV